MAFGLIQSPFSSNAIRQANQAIQIPLSAQTIYNAAEAAQVGYKRLRDWKEVSGPSLRGVRNPRVVSGQVSSGLSNIISASRSSTMCSSNGWRRSFGKSRLSRYSRRRYRRRFIYSRNKRQYLGQWESIAPTVVGGTAAGQTYRYASLPFNINSILLSMKTANDSGNQVDVVLPMGQKVFCSSLVIKLYLKNPFSIGMNYRIFAVSYTGRSSVATDFSGLVPWAPIFRQPEWLNAELTFEKQYNGLLNADQDTTLIFTFKPGFIRWANNSFKEKVYHFYIYTWSELQFQSGANFTAAISAGYIDIASLVFSRAQANFIVDQGVNLNDNIQEGYVAPLAAIATPKVKTEDKMEGANF